eukprot:Seg319.10 transcript_id=Seg319.10/GoldUCD/mRNA.D3Y31 product=Peroxidasin protein_id=Seg319.10/GoldUCD/D3Y31
MGNEKTESQQFTISCRVFVVILVILNVGAIVFALKLANQQFKLKDDLKNTKEELRSLGLKFDQFVEEISTVKSYPSTHLNRLKRSAIGVRQQNDQELLEYIKLFCQGKVDSKVKYDRTVASCKCKDGRRGPRGKSGPKGEKGEDGLHGSRGPTGPRGLRGEKGDKGQRGDAGPRGHPGQSVEKPRFTTTPKKTTVQQGAVATFTCSATGHPKPIIKWYHKNALIKSSKKFTVLAGGAGLQINDVRGNDYGQVKCVASNVIGTVESYALLTVQVPPSVRITKRQLMVYEGQNFELRCTAAGIPRPRITWQRVRGSLPSSAKILQGGVVSFKGARTSDSGLYQCVAKNSAGTSLQTMTLYVRAVYKSCKETLSNRPDLGDGFYKLSSGEHYCIMKDISGCGGGGWTLAMKLDGSKSTFQSTSIHWTRNTVYKESGVMRSLTGEAKFAAFNSLTFKEICVGMEHSGKTKWLRLSVGSSSLLDLFKSGRYVATRVGRSAWKGLIQGSSLQPHCNREGINVKHNGGTILARVGFIGNQENECNSPDSYIGFGTLRNRFCSGLPMISCGNIATCSPDNGVKSLPVIGYILIK